MDPISNFTKTLQINKPSSDVNDAIAFIPALSSKYKLVKANPTLQMYTLSGSELSSGNAYIDISCSTMNKNKTGVKLEVRRKTGSFYKSSEVSLGNQHIDTVLSLLSDSLTLDPSEKSRLLSEWTNEKTAGEHRTTQAITEAKKKTGEKRQTTYITKKTQFYFVFSLLFCAVLYGLYRYFRQ
jgi:hypothetical protein